MPHKVTFHRFRGLVCGHLGMEWGGVGSISQPTIIHAFGGLKKTLVIGQFLCWQNHQPCPHVLPDSFLWEIQQHGFPAQQRTRMPSPLCLSVLFFGQAVLIRTVIMKLNIIVAQGGRRRIRTLYSSPEARVQSPALANALILGRSPHFSEPWCTCL